MLYILRRRQTGYCAETARELPESDAAGPQSLQVCLPLFTPCNIVYPK